MKKDNFVIDIETLGNVPGSIILEVGCVKFNPSTGEILDEILVSFDQEESVRHGFITTPSTLKWWSKQPCFSMVLNRVPKSTLNAGLSQLFNFIGYPNDAIIWANSPIFDISLLQCYYDKFAFLDYPWKPWNLRDIRTLVELVGVNKATANTHGALEHCKNQVDWIVQGLRKVDPLNEK